MSASEVVTIIIAVSAVLLPAVSLLIVTVIGKLREMGGKIDAVVTKSAVIEAHVNGEKSAAQGRENALMQEVKLLREMVEEKKATANLLAQQVAQSTPSVTLPDAAKAVDVHVVNPPASPVPTTQITA